MSFDETNPLEVRRLRTLQVIIVAITMGAAMFLVLVAFLPNGDETGKNPDDRLPIVTIMAVGWGVLSLPVGLMVSAVVAKAGVGALVGRSSPSTGPRTKNGGSLESEMAEQLLRIYQSKTIIATALVEGAVLFAGVAYLIEQRVYALGIAVLLMLALVLQIPTRDRMQRWLASRMRRIEEDRQMQGSSRSG